MRQNICGHPTGQGVRHFAFFRFSYGIPISGPSINGINGLLGNTAYFYRNKGMDGIPLETLAGQQDLFPLVVTIIRSWHRQGPDLI